MPKSEGDGLLSSSVEEFRSADLLAALYCAPGTLVFLAILWLLTS